MVSDWSLFFGVFYFGMQELKNSWDIKLQHYTLGMPGLEIIAQNPYNMTRRDTLHGKTFLT